MTTTRLAQRHAWLWGALCGSLLWGGFAVAQPNRPVARPTPAPATPPPKVKRLPRTTPVARAVVKRPPRDVPKPRRTVTPSSTVEPPVPARPAPAKRRAPKRTGLALQMSLGTAAQVYANTNATAAYPGMSGRFQFGYRVGRITLALGVEFVRTESTDAAGEETNAHVVLFRPTLELALWKPWPLSLYLSLGVHGGFLGTAGRGVVDDALPAVGFHGGLGVRYFFHPRFALGMEGGFQGVWLVDDDGDDTVDGTVMFYGAFVLLAIL